MAKEKEVFSKSELKKEFVKGGVSEEIAAKMVVLMTPLLAAGMTIKEAKAAAKRKLAKRAKRVKGNK